MKHRFFTQVTALAVVIGLLLTGTLFPAAARSISDIADSPGGSASYADPIKDDNIIISDEILLRADDPSIAEESMILKYVDSAQFNAARHTRRLTDSEDLNTYVFANADGTRSVYMMSENVKYVDKDGIVREKDISLKSKAGGYGIAQSDIGLFIPTDPARGIDFEYSGYAVKLIPQGLTSAESAVRSDNSVVYNGAYGANTKLVYTPTLSGVKEDIVLSEYTDNAVYTFLLETDGLNLYRGDSGYYLAESDKADPLFRLGEIIIYDAVGKPDVGRMTVRTVTDRQRYLLTVIANDGFLSDPDTVYPVTVDPSITVSSGEASELITDSPIFANYPDRNCGSYKYNSIGTTSEAYGIGRTVVKLNGLMGSDEYLTVKASQITGVSFYAKESSGGNPRYINLYPLTGNTTWTETSVTWNNVGSHTTSVNYGNTMNNGRWTAFDITDLVKAWKNGTYSPDAGFIMINENESDNKSFCSSEFSTSSYRPYVVMTYDNRFAGAETISLNSSKSVNILSAEAEKIFKFIPPGTGFYSFESSDISTGNPKAWLYNSDYTELAFNDDSAGNLNFRLTYHLVAGTTYYFAAGCFNPNPAAYTVKVVTTTVPSSIPAVSLSWGGGSRYASCDAQNKAVFYRFIPSQSGEYMFFSTASSGDPKIWLYDSNMSMIGSNDDGAGNRNFRLSASLFSGQTYYIVAGEFGTNTGTYYHYLSKATSVSTSVNYLRNVGTSKYMDIEGPGTQEWVHQWTLHSDLQEKWALQRQSDGYYTIRSQYDKKYYVGISSASAGVDNIKLYSGVTDSTKWKMYEISPGNFVLEPKTAPGKVLYVPNSSTGTKLQLSNLGARVSERNIWNVLNIGAYFSQVYNYFDYGYSVYYNASNSASRITINGYMDDIANRYYQLLGLTLLYDSASYYESPIDICKGTVTSSNISTLCSHSGIVHTERGNVISSFKNIFFGGNTTTNVLWSCHAITSTATNGDINYNRSCSSGDAIIMIERSGSSNRNRNSKGVLMHELNHQYGAKDHYHELADKNDPNSCKFKSICSDCGDNPRPSTCIMYQSRIDISNSNVICSACRNDMLSHLNDHHSN